MKKNIVKIISFALVICLLACMGTALADYPEQHVQHYNTFTTDGKGTPLFKVNIPADQQGAVVADKTQAPKDATVTLTVAPGTDAGKLKVTAEDGSKVLLEKINDTTYAFKMPGCNVDVDAGYVPDGKFEDVKDSDYFSEAVEWAVNNGITKGTSATRFSPDDITTRGQIVTFLWRAAGSPEPNTKANPFADVKESSYCYKAVLWAVENGITKGTSDTTFSPDELCTRAHIITFLWRAKGCIEAKNAAPYTDVSEKAFYAGSSAWAYENGIVDGIASETLFGGNEPCTRAQAVTFMFRAK